MSDRYHSSHDLSLLWRGLWRGSISMLVTQESLLRHLGAWESSMGDKYLIFSLKIFQTDTSTSIQRPKSRLLPQNKSLLPCANCWALPIWLTPWRLSAIFILGYSTLSSNCWAVPTLLAPRRLSAIFIIGCLAQSINRWALPTLSALRRLSAMFILCCSA